MPYSETLVQRENNACLSLRQPAASGGRAVLELKIHPPTTHQNTPYAPFPELASECAPKQTGETEAGSAAGCPQMERYFPGTDVGEKVKTSQRLWGTEPGRALNRDRTEAERDPRIFSFRRDWNSGCLSSMVLKSAGWNDVEPGHGKTALPLANPPAIRADAGVFMKGAAE